YLSPYRGLQRFEKRHAAFFRGRDRDLAELLPLIEANRVVVVQGAAGSGKSSLLRAGVAPRVEGRRFAERTGWRCVVVEPGERPIEALDGALPGPPSLAGAGSDEAGLIQRIKARVESELKRGPLLLLVDQFEELFSRCRDPKQATARVLLEVAQ